MNIYNNCTYLIEQIQYCICNYQMVYVQIWVTAFEIKLSRMWFITVEQYIWLALIFHEYISQNQVDSTPPHRIGKFPIRYCKIWLVKLSLSKQQ